MKIAIPLLLGALVVGLAACTSRPTTSRPENDSGAGPQVYGQVSVSIDHVDSK